MSGQIGRRKSGARWALVRAHAPKLSSCVIFVFALATILPWLGYLWFMEMDRAAEIAKAGERLELLAAVYAERANAAIRAQPGAPVIQVPPDQNAVGWISSLPQFAHVSFLSHPVPRREGLESPTTAQAQAVNIYHRDGVLHAEVDLPGASIAAVASLPDDDVLKEWNTRTRLSLIALLIRTAISTAIGIFLFYQLRWREAAQVELMRTREAAEKATRVKSEFLANMSHELRTPLNAIIGFSEAIKLGMFGALSNRYREYGGHVFSSGTHLLQLVDDILDISKLEAGRFELEEAEVDVHAVVRSVMPLVQGLAEKSEVTIREDIGPPLPLIYGDARRIQQAVLNLVSNAIKFTPQGGEVQVSAMETAGGIRINVSDSGIGMTADQIPVALQPFRQIKSRFRSSFSGTGLGLPITKHLVELHGGTLTIASQVNVGTTVTICLPAARIIRGRTRADVDRRQAIPVAAP
jgi:signal transduction histidine kinase